MNADKNYRMTKQTKIMLALSKFKSAEDRNTFKKLMIQAELIAKNTKFVTAKEKE